jgi:hypothetical protein
VIPFLTKLAEAKRVLIAGCGGGFDVFAGVPLAHQLIGTGKHVTFANLSFTNLWLSSGERVTPVCWRVDQQANELPYFPEKWLAEWLVGRGQEAPIYAFAKSGVRPLRQAYETIIQRHNIDLVILVDGGTDSVLFGDEPGLGTVAEDAISTVAACAASVETSIVLAAIGFGIDHHHGVSHHAFLENVARVTQDGGFLGVCSLTPGTPEADALLDLVDFANHRQPQHQSIVCNSIASSLRGEFGNYHATNRTSGSELFINPLMSQYWTFDARCVVHRMTYADALAETDSMEDARRIIEDQRQTLDVRPRQGLPL